MKKNTKGFSLFEMLMVTLILGILGAVTTQIIFLALKSSTKSESTVFVRENLNYAMSIMERELRNASSISCTSESRIDYKNFLGLDSSFSCTETQIASNSAQMTGDNISITGCNFLCDQAVAGRPAAVTIHLSAKNTNKSGADASAADISTKIYLRNY